MTCCKHLHADYIKIVGPNQDMQQWSCASEASTDSPSAMTSNWSVTRHFLAAKLQHDVEVVPVGASSRMPSVLQSCPSLALASVRQNR